MFYWLLFNTSLSKWLIDRCWLSKLHSQTKKYQHTITFNEQYAYKTTLVFQKQQDRFQSKLFKNGKNLSTITFTDPVDWAKQLWKLRERNEDVNEFVDLLLH